MSTLPKVVDLRGKLPVHKSKHYGNRKLTDIRSIGIHHSLTFSGSAEAFAGYHVNTNGWPGIGYAYVVDRDGSIYQCWDHTVMTYHVGDSNKHALGICLVGDFRTQVPTEAQYRATAELVRMLQQAIPSAQKVLGHSEYPGYSWKACPVIDMHKLRADVASGLPGEEEDALKFETWQWRMMGDALDGIYRKSISGEIKPPLITDYKWAEKAYRGQLTLQELSWLNVIMAARQNGIDVH